MPAQIIGAFAVPTRYKAVILAERKILFARVIVILWAIVWVATSLVQFLGIVDFKRYIWSLMFDPVVMRLGHGPEAMGYLFNRYLVSLALRVVGVLTGVGLLLYWDFARKLGLCACYFTIITIAFKHSGIPQHVWLLKLIFCAADIIFASAFIYCFSRPSVVALYKNRTYHKGVARYEV